MQRDDSGRQNGDENASRSAVSTEYERVWSAGHAAWHTVSAQ